MKNIETLVFLKEMSLRGTMSLACALWVSLICVPVFAEVPDTHGNRIAMAERYLATVSMKDMMRDMTLESAKNFQEGVRQDYIRFMNSTIRVEVLERAALASLARHFTVGELRALATFYGSPEGKSTMKKMGVYMADLMPVLTQEMQRAHQLLQGNTKQ